MPVSYSTSFEDFTDLAVSLEFLSSHLIYLWNSYKNTKFRAVLKKLSEDSTIRFKDGADGNVLVSTQQALIKYAILEIIRVVEY